MVFACVGAEGERAKILEQRLAALGIALVRLPSKPEASDLYYRIDGHWNIKGHNDTAQRLLPLVQASLNTYRLKKGENDERPPSPPTTEAARR